MMKSKYTQENEKPKSMLRKFGQKCNSELNAILNKNIKQYYFVQNILSKYCQIIKFNILKLFFYFGIHKMRKNHISKHNKKDFPSGSDYT